MLPIERKNAILTRLVADGKVIVSDLALEYGVTEETIRRDLDKLAQEGLAEKFYGGAIKAENTFFDLPFHVRQSSNTGEKKKIAELVIPMIHDGDYIALDSSTTALEVIKAAKNIKNLTIITPSVEVMIEFSQKADWNIVSTGGILKTGSLSLVGGIAEKTAFGYIAKYMDEHEVSVNKAEVSRLVSKCTGIKRTTGQHPGGIVVVPKEYEIYDFCPVQHPADDANSDIVTTHFTFEYLHDTLLKLDELGHDMPTKYKAIENFTNTSVLDVPMNDPKVYELFLSTETLGGKDLLKDLKCKVGTYGLPEFGTKFVQQMLEDAKPKNFSDLLQISGLSHGTDVWLGNAKDLIDDEICTISNVIGTRDSIMTYLLYKGVEPKHAFQIMEDTRKGKAPKTFTPERIQMLKDHDVPQWYIDSCLKIKYMFPKAHAAAYVISAIRLGWYKVHMPLEFYCAYLSVAPGGFEASMVAGGKGGILKRIADLEAKGNEATQKEKEQIVALQLAFECLARNIQFLPVDLMKSDAFKFLPEDGKIRLPFSSIAGIGDNAAEKIAQIRDGGDIFSVEDFQQRSRLSNSVIKTLQDNGVFSNMAESNQISMIF